MTQYVLGVDTGATKSHAALFDTGGSLVDFGLWGPLNYELMPGLYVQFEDELGRFITGLLAANGLVAEQIAYCVLGVAGVDTRRQHNTISQIVSRIGLQNFTLCNDAYLGVPAGSPTGAGICAINGTGFCLAGISPAGGMLQIGGVGALSADAGGGGYLGERAVAAAYSELFRKGPATALTPLLFQKLGITDKYDFLEQIYEQTEAGIFQVHHCGHLVFEAVHKGDAAAEGILQEVAACYANGIACMVEELRFPHEETLAIVLAGSVFVKGEHPLLLDALKAQVYGSHPGRDIAFTLLDAPTVAGAVVWALNSLGAKDIRHETVCGVLRRTKPRRIG